jgi:hypothetical protein
MFRGVTLSTYEYTCTIHNGLSPYMPQFAEAGVKYQLSLAANFTSDRHGITYIKPLRYTNLAQYRSSAIYLSHCLPGK